MTKINKLILHGFKSFAKYTELEFGDHYNCVLGPNGSGKSNILDSLTFVLGKAGSKSMRAEKSANLIYNGGKVKKPAKKGEVSIIFDNKDKTFPTEEQEVKVTRIIKNNGQSVYKINDQVRTRQQILDLLNIAKIDPDGYNIILQGDIIRFCDMSTTDRRLLIEEISGISMYEEKKQKAVNQLEKVDERLKESEIILSERSTYLKELKKDRDQALKFKELSENVKKFKASLLKLQIDKQEGDQSALQEKIDANAKSLKDSSEKIAKFKEEINQKKAEIETITKDIEHRGEQDQVNLNREIEQLKIEMTKKTSRLDTLALEIKKIKQREEDLQKSTVDTDQKIGQLNKQKDDFNKTKQEHDKNKAQLDAKISAFKQKHNIESAADHEKRIDQIDQEVESFAKEMQTLREKQHNLLRDKDKVEHELNTIDQAMQKVREIEKEHKQQLEELKEKRSSFKKTTLELNKALDEDSTLTAKSNETRNKIHQLSEELAKLEARNASLKEASQSDKAIKAILDKKAQGVYGLVSDLGSVDAKYSTALEVAAGNRIKSIVVEDDKIAAEQIKQLRQARLGTASFIPLNKIKPKGLDDRAKKIKDKSIGVASDLVSYDQKFKKVFSYLFGDTLIIDNMEKARKLGIGEAKMVSLEGDVAEVSGVMRGGFRDRKKGLGFSEAQLDKNIEKTTNSIQEYTQNLSSFDQRRKELEEKISQLRSVKAELEGEIIKAEKSLHLESSDMNSSKNREAELKDQQKHFEKEINEIQNTISEKNRHLAQIKIEKQQLRAQVTQLRSPTLVAELATYEEQKQKFNEQIVQITAEVKNIEVQINDIFNPEKEKIKSILKQLEKDEHSFSLESEQLKKQVDTDKNTLDKKEKDAQKFYAQFKELFHKRSQLNDSINKSESQIAIINEKSREIEIRSNTLSIKNAEISALLAGLKEEFSQYEGVQLDTEKTEEQLKYQLQKFEKMKEEVGTVNMRALEIYEEIEKEYEKLLAKKETLASEKADVEKLMEEIESKKTELFMKTYNSVNDEFKKIFLSLSRKGEASLELENPESPFDDGVRIKVRVSGQKFLDIRSLSGGEKTMTALAFIFAIQEHDPASFYILDEVDAALDKHNSEKLSKLIRSYSDKAQYIIISHNDSIISEADHLYGISMDEHGMSKMVSLRV